MSWSLIVAIALAGFIVGFRYRAPALLVVTLAVLLCIFALILLPTWTWGEALRFGIVLLAVEHLAYFIGLALSLAIQRRRNKAG